MKGTILLQQHRHHETPCFLATTSCAEGQEIPGLTTIHQLTKRPAHLPSSPVASDVQNARHRLESAIWAWRDPFTWYRSKDWFTIRTSKLCIFDWYFCYILLSNIYILTLKSWKAECWNNLSITGPLWPSSAQSVGPSCLDLLAAGGIVREHCEMSCLALR